MATPLTGFTPATTYDSLLKLGDNNSLTSTSKVVSDGLGNDTLINLSTTAFRLVAPANVGGTDGFYFDGSTNRVSIGINSATARLQVRGSGSTASSTALLVENSLASAGMVVNDAGRVGIGTASPSAQLTIRGTTATDGGQLGNELLTTANWTTTGWTGDFTTGFTNGASNTTPLTNTLAAVVNNYYQIAYTISGNTGGGSLTFGFGGQSISGVTATGAWGPRATTTGSFSITPTATFNGTVIISIKIISAGDAIVSLQNSAGNTSSQLFASSSNTNLFLGNGAGSRNTTGINNSGSGSNALQNNTTGTSNTAFGSSALFSNTIGSSNTATGHSALQNNLTGNNNSAFGSGALRDNTIGASNSAFGSGALRNNTIGGSNSAFGIFALFANTTGSNNSGFGYGALQRNTTGINNTAIGTSASFENTTGSNNTSLGLNALNLNVAGDNNTSLGFSSLGNITSGSTNVAIGVSAGRYLANGSTFNLNTNSSIFIGADSRSSIDEQTNQIVIGSSAIGEGSNSVVLGNTSVVKTVLRRGVEISTGPTSGTNPTPPTVSLTVTGIGNTASTRPLLVRNGAGTPYDLIDVRDDGVNVINFSNGSNGLARVGTGKSIVLRGGLNPTDTNDDDVLISNAQGDPTIASGTRRLLSVRQRGFAPTSGNGQWIVQEIGGIINQTGGANGITRGLYINPTLTSAANWRSIETSNNAGYAAYFGGTADLFLNNEVDIQLGTGTGTKIGTATDQKLAFYNATPVVQRSNTNTVQDTPVNGTVGATVLTDTTFGGYTIGQIVKALQTLGLLA